MRDFLCGLVVKCNKECICARVVQGRCVWLVDQCIRENLTEDVRRHVIFVCPVENAVFFGAFVAFSTLIDEVLFDKLLELLQQQHALSICDRQRAEGVEARIF